MARGGEAELLLEALVVHEGDDVDQNQENRLFDIDEKTFELAKERSVTS